MKKNLLKDCFWDYSLTFEDIEKMAKDDNEQHKNFLFEKILANSRDVLNDLKIFSEKDLKEMITNYKIPKFNYKFLKKRHMILKYFFLGQKVSIMELEWKT
mgnify:CR=1 FL=1